MSRTPGNVVAKKQKQKRTSLFFFFFASRSRHSLTSASSTCTSSSSSPSLPPHRNLVQPLGQPPDRRPRSARSPPLHPSSGGSLRPGVERREGKRRRRPKIRPRQPQQVESRRRRGGTRLGRRRRGLCDPPSVLVGIGIRSGGGGSSSRRNSTTAFFPAAVDNSGLASAGDGLDDRALPFRCGRGRRQVARGRGIPSGCRGLGGPERGSGAGVHLRLVVVELVPGRRLPRGRSRGAQRRLW